MLGSFVIRENLANPALGNEVGGREEKEEAEKREERRRRYPIAWNGSHLSLSLFPPPFLIETLHPRAPEKRSPSPPLLPILAPIPSRRGGGGDASFLPAPGEEKAQQSRRRLRLITLLTHRRQKRREKMGR